MSTLLNVIAHFETNIVDAIDASSSSLELKSISTPHGDIPAGTYGFTIEEESGSRREYVVGTLVDNTLTFVKRDVSVLDGTTENASDNEDRQSHRAGSSIKLTNHPALQRVVRILDGTDDLSASAPLKYDGVVTPTEDNELTTKAWVLSVVTGGTVTFDRQVWSGIAGETITSGDYVFLDETDGKWYQFDASETSHVAARCKGIALGAGTINNLITNGVQLSGPYGSGYTAGQLYYATDVAGAIGTSAGTFEEVIGVGSSNGALLIFNSPAKLSNAEKAALAGTSGTPGADNKYVTDDDTTGEGDVVRESLIKSFSAISSAASSGTAANDMFLFGYASFDLSDGNGGSWSLSVDGTVRAQGGGDSGSSSNNDDDQQTQFFMIPIPAGASWITTTNDATLHLYKVELT